jgi:uncharacterized membrane-anchored protein
MKNITVMAGLIIMITFQLFVLMGEYIGATYPLYTGTEIKLRTIPVDPRSMFRGNYARLNYDVSTFKSDELDISDLRMDEIVYVKLRAEEKNIYEFDSVSIQRPKSGLYLRGRIKSQPWSKEYRVIYGIEAFFAPKEKALALEKDLRDGGLAVVAVAGNGKAVLKDIIAEP